MFKVEKVEHSNKTFRLPDPLIAELEQVAQEKRVSLNQLVIQCCKYALQNLDKDETDTCL